MPSDSLLVGIVVLVLAAAGAVWWHLTALPKACTRFLQRTGYRLAGKPDAPLSEQGREVSIGLGAATRHRGPWRRTLQGLTLFYEGESRLEQLAGRPVLYTWEHWRIVMPGPSRCSLQVADRYLDDPQERRRLGPRTVGGARTWSRKHPHEVSVGDAAFDKRFVVTTDNPEQAARVFASAELRRSMLALAEVDLVLQGNEVRLDDPSGMNRERYVGMAPAPQEQTLERETSLHDAVAFVLRLTARAALA